MTRGRFTLVITIGTVRHLIGDAGYFKARSEASPRLYFRKHERALRIFEYGCGVGQNIASLPGAAGWDISDDALDVCEKRRIRVFRLLDDVPRASWDIVLCQHVLEHIEQRLLALRQMRELVAPGGELLLVLPKERHYGSELAPDHNQHLYCWNFRTVNNLLARAGFSPRENSCCYLLGFRVLLPVRRLFGDAAYDFAVRSAGRLCRNGELLIRVQPR